MSQDSMQAPQRVEFTANCFGATLSVARQLGGTWALSLFTFAGKSRKYRAIATALGSRGEVPRLAPARDGGWPILWLGSSAMDIPPKLVPKLQAFIAEHTAGGGG